MQITLDGFVAGPNGEGDWVVVPGKQDPGALQATMELIYSCDTLLLGRKNTRPFVDHWAKTADQPESPWQPFARYVTNMRKIVFSKTETAIAGTNLKVENGDLATVVNKLKSQPGNDIMVYGGVNFVSSLIELDLVDEYNFIVNPVAMGNGMQVFKERNILQLKSSRAFANGKVINKYVRS